MINERFRLQRYFIKVCSSRGDTLNQVLARLVFAAKQVKVIDLASMILNMLRCALCGADLGEHDGYVRGSISGEVVELPEGSSPRPTGQKNSWEGLAFCLSHFEDIPKNLSENISRIATKRKHDNKP